MNKMITIVSGLPRSGTSMMMRMLEAGGIEVMTDNIRKADEDNPHGYFEFEIDILYISYNDIMKKNRVRMPKL